MSKIFFLPYIGKNYEGGFRNKKVLIVDSVHYCDYNYEDSLLPSNIINDNIMKLTIEMIRGIKERENEIYTKAYINFEKAMNGGIFINEEDRIGLWESLAFYHYCQKSLADFYEKPSYDLLNESFDAFVEVVDKYKPDIIISWGKYVENILAAKLGYSEKYRIDESVIYTFNNKGNEILLFPIHHPSFDFSWKNYHKVINKVFDLEK